MRGGGSLGPVLNGVDTMSKGILAVLVLFSLVLNGGMVLAQDPLSVVNPASKFERVFSGGFWLESLAVAPAGSVYFLDIPYTSVSGMQTGRIWRYDPRTGVKHLPDKSGQRD